MQLADQSVYHNKLLTYNVYSHQQLGPNSIFYFESITYNKVIFYDMYECGLHIAFSGL